MFCSEILLDHVIPVDSFEDRGSLLRTFCLRSKDNIFIYPSYLYVYERGVAVSSCSTAFCGTTEYFVTYDEFMSYEAGYSHHMVAHHIIELCRQYIQFYNHWEEIPETGKFIRDVDCYCLDNKQRYSISVVASAIVDSYPSRAYYKHEIDRHNEKSEVKRNALRFKYDKTKL